MMMNKGGTFKIILMLLMYEVLMFCVVLRRTNFNKIHSEEDKRCHIFVVINHGNHLLASSLKCIA
jgi:hypothetical protein